MWRLMMPRSPEWEAAHCSSCGGEKDAEGWCANYCTDDYPPAGVVIIQIQERIKSRAGRKEIEFVLFRLTWPVPDDCMGQEKIRALVQAEQPTFQPLSVEDVYYYAQIFPERARRTLFVLGSWGYGTPRSEGGFLGTYEIQPDGGVKVREHWCLGGPLFAWSPETTFIMKVVPPPRNAIAGKSQ